MNMNLGQEGEEMVAKEYQKQGYKIIERNYRIHSSWQVGEIDLIAVKDRQVVFVEVKTRTNQAFGGPLEAVGYNKQRKLARMAKLYMMHTERYWDYEFRIDVALVLIDNGRPFVTILPNVIEDN